MWVVSWVSSVTTRKPELPWAVLLLRVFPLRFVSISPPHHFPQRKHLFQYEGSLGIVRQGTKRLKKIMIRRKIDQLYRVVQNQSRFYFFWLALEMRGKRDKPASLQVCLKRRDCPWSSYKRIREEKFLNVFRKYSINCSRFSLWLPKWGHSSSDAIGWTLFVQDHVSINTGRQMMVML